MTFHPGILALLLGSGLTTAMLCSSAFTGARIIRHWDIGSGSEQQLDLERKTYLISTVMGYCMGFQILSLFLFIYTADTLSPLFIGAMCAAGSLKVNGFGYPTLLLKIVNCLLAGLWLIVNHTDNQAHDYPLIRTKYWWLLIISPFLVAETITQNAYFLSLKPNIITSCCGMLFSTDANTLLSDLLALPLSLSHTIFWISTLLAVASGLYVFLKTKGASLFFVASIVQGVVSINALFSFISIYFYELPTHHCPFCILHREYGYIGYLLYLLILVSTVSGMGTGILQRFRTISSLRDVIPRVQRRLALVAILAIAAFVVITGYGVMFSNLSMTACTQRQLFQNVKLKIPLQMNFSDSDSYCFFAKNSR